MNPNEVTIDSLIPESYSKPFIIRIQIIPRTLWRDPSLSWKKAAMFSITAPSTTSKRYSTLSGTTTALPQPCSSICKNNSRPTRNSPQKNPSSSNTSPCCSLITYIKIPLNLLIPTSRTSIYCEPYPSLSYVRTRRHVNHTSL